MLGLGFPANSFWRGDSFFCFRCFSAFVPGCSACGPRNRCCPTWRVCCSHGRCRELYGASGTADACSPASRKIHRRLSWAWVWLLHAVPFGAVNDMVIQVQPVTQTFITKRMSPACCAHLFLIHFQVISHDKPSVIAPTTQLDLAIVSDVSEHVSNDAY